MRDEAKVRVDSLNSAQLHSFFLCAFNNQHASNGGILVENNFTSNCFISREPLFYPFRKDLPNPKQFGFPKKWPLKPGKDRLPTSHPFFWVPGSSRSFFRRLWSDFHVQELLEAVEFRTHRHVQIFRQLQARPGEKFKTWKRGVFFCEGWIFVLFRKEVNMLRLTINTI